MFAASQTAPPRPSAERAVAAKWKRRHKSTDSAAGPSRGGERRGSDAGPSAGGRTLGVRSPSPAAPTTAAPDDQHDLEAAPATPRPARPSVSHWSAAASPASGASAKSENGELDVPEVVVSDESVPKSMWRKGAVLGMLRNMLPSMNSSMSMGFSRQLSDIDTGGQLGDDVEENVKYEYAFDENSACVYGWETTVFVVCLYNLIAIPFPAFDDVFKNHYHAWVRLNVLADVIYLGDMVASCFIAIYINGLKIRDVSIIGLRYIRTTKFFLDLSAILPIDYPVYHNPSAHMLRINRLIKCYRVFGFLSRIQMHTKHPNVIVLAKVIIPIVFIFHWNACGYFALSLYYGIEDRETGNWPFSFSKIMDPIFSDCNWLPWTMDCQLDEELLNGTQKEDYIEDLVAYWKDKTITSNYTDLVKKYVLSFYWSSMTITTLGEQPEPDVSTENLYEIMDTVIGILIFGAIMGSVAEIVQNANRHNRELRSDLDMVKIYMQNRRVQESVQKRVFSYFEFAINEDLSLDDPTKDPSLSTSLRAEIRNQVLLSYLRTIELFRDVSEVFLRELVEHFRTQLFGPGDFVCMKGDVCRELFIVETGVMVEIAKNEITNTLRKGASFGSLQLVYIPEHRFEDRRHTTLLSVSFSEVHKLHVSDFRRIVKDFPQLEKELENRTRSMLASYQLLRSEEEMMNARYREQAYHNVDDKLQQIKRQRRHNALSRQVNEIERKWLRKRDQLAVRHMV